MTPDADPPVLRAARLLGPLGCLGLHVVGLDQEATAPAWTMGGILWWVALWWMTEAMPVGATSLLPALLLPAFGVLDSATVASTYMDRFILLMMAGFMASLAIERTGLHRRMALFTLFHIGTSPRRLVLGLLIATAAISAWIANTAATLIMLPVGLALIDRLGGGAAPSARAFGTAACLAIAYGASIGGMATPLGTPTNLVYFGAVERATGQAPGFLAWVIDALPIVIGLVASAAFILGRGLPAVSTGGDSEARRILAAERAALGPLRQEERHVAAIFSVMILAWITREAILADGTRVGWAPLLGLGKYVDDATVAVGGALVLFAWPARALDGGRLLTWDAARRIPWEVVLLFGGGLALARGFDRSGLDAAAAEILSGLAGLPSIVVIAVVALLVTFLTEVTSNTAVATLLMPILAAVGAATGLPPETTMLPAAISASCAFMLPVATPPNAVVYGMGHVTIGQMARAGLALNLAGVVIITAWLWLRHGA